MDPVTIGLGLMLLYGAYKVSGKKPAQLGQGETWQSFSPGAQEKAWYMTKSILWSAAGTATDKKGNVAILWTGLPASGDSEPQRSANDQWLRNTMGNDYRIVVSDRIMIPEQGALRRMAFLPSGFSASGLPSNMGVMLQLFAGPPDMAPGGFQGQGLQELPPGMIGPGGGLGFMPGGMPGGGQFSDIGDPGLRAKVQSLYSSDTVALKDLDDTATALEKMGAVHSAQVLRERRKTLEITRRLDAQQRGGYPFIVRGNGTVALDLPLATARYYGGNRSGVLGELAGANPAVSANKWAKWGEGSEVLLPVTWFPAGTDPSTKPLPPLASMGKPVPGQPGLPGQVILVPPSGGLGQPGQPPLGTTLTPWGNYVPGQPPPGTVLVPFGQSVPVAPGSVSYPVPQGILYGPSGKWTPPSPGKLEPYGPDSVGSSVEVGVTPSQFMRS